MEIRAVKNEEKKDWNSFIKNNYPPIGAFMATWEWGDFQKKLGRIVERFFIVDKGKVLGAFTLIQYSLPRGFKYGYAPRGPVLAREIIDKAKIIEIFNFLNSWAKRNLPNFIFLRFEPPFSESIHELKMHGFKFPSYYIQPRHNHAVPLIGSEEDIEMIFHPSTRSNLSRAERRGVTVEMKKDLTEGEYRDFANMMTETSNRTQGKNVYPSEQYFKAFLETMPRISDENEPATLSLAIFYGYQHNEPSAANFVLFFGDTATYLYGASYIKHLNSKVTTYLHWVAMKEAKRRGLKYYDIGGIDEKRWPSLTAFKRQFRGQEFSYIGNIDLPIRPVIYSIYNIARRLKF